SAARWQRRGEQWRPRALLLRRLRGLGRSRDARCRSSLPPPWRAVKPQVSAPRSRGQTMGSWWLLPAAGPARDSDLVRGVGSGGRQRSRGGDPTRGAVLVLRTRAELARPWVPARNLRTGCTPGTCRERGTRSALRPFPRLVRFTGPRCGAGPR
uniref:Uncharacterized protein n=1 Tax=Cricetulus griseus TaxID=10029 RepID=A0A8C2QMQ0_CRIGR